MSRMRLSKNDKMSAPPGAPGTSTTPDKAAARATAKASARATKEAERLSVQGASQPSRKRRAKGASSPTAGQSGVLLSRTLTSFDFTNNAFLKARNTRILNFVATGVVALAIMVVGSQYATLLTAERSRSSEITQLETRRLAVTSELSTVSDAGGLSESELQGHMDERLATIAAVTMSETAYGTVVADVLATAPPGSTITNFQLTFSDGVPVVDPAAPVTTTTTTPGADAAAPLVPVPSHRLTVVTAAATAGNPYDDIAAWRTGLSQYQYLEELAITWAGPPSALVITIAAKISPTLLGPFGSGVATTFNPEPPT